MKTWNALALVLVLVSSPAVLAQASGTEAPPASAAADASAEALRIYEEGKRLYDAKDYAGALQKFDEAAIIEPGKARWQYNRGLTLRKLGRYDEAREALLRSRELDPQYKRAEIDDKLTEMGFPVEDAPVPAGGTPAPESAPAEDPGPLATFLGVVICLGVPTGLLIGVILLIRALLRKKPGAPGQAASRPRRTYAPGELSARSSRLAKLGDLLVSVEHAMRLGEDPDARALLNRATDSEHKARVALMTADRGEEDLRKVDALLGEAESMAQQAMERVRTRFGEQAFSGTGERVGCYFCARPLANPEFRRRVPLKRGADVTEVLACPPCANIAATGQSPAVKVHPQGGRQVHWSEAAGYDPYVHRHRVFPGIQSVPAWNFTPERSVGELAMMAAGGALVGGAAVYAAGKLLDLDGAREAALAQEAAMAAARNQVGPEGHDRDWRDHS